MHPTQGEGVKSDFATAGEAADWWIDRLLSRPMLNDDRAQIMAHPMRDDCTEHRPRARR